MGPIVCSHYNDSVVIAMAHMEENGVKKKNINLKLNAFWMSDSAHVALIFHLFFYIFFFCSCFVRENGQMGIFSLWHFSESRLHLMLPAACWAVVSGFSF